jgi:competence protein ComEA
VFGKERRNNLMVLVALALLVCGGVVLLSRLPPAGSVQVVLPPATDTPRPTGTPAPIRVYVCGEVNQPDVYELPAGSIVKDALQSAGGATDAADLIRINLAHVLQDEDQVYVPTQGDEASMPAVVRAPSSWGAGQQSDGVNINTASLDELQSLPGIGPVLAQRIVEHRPYRRSEDILEVPGIGETTYAKLKDLIVVQ